MSDLRIERLDLLNFRNHRQLSLEFTSPLVIVVGDNAVGKTNLIEALQLLSMQSSFRNPQWQELKSWSASGSDPCSAALVYDGAVSAPATLQLRILAGQRQFWLNGKKRGSQELASLLPAVLFSPDDLNIAKGQPLARRELLDSLGTRLSKTFASIKRDYGRSLKQKNLLLRQDRPDPLVLESWNHNLAQLGASLFTHRLGLYYRLLQVAASIYVQFSGGEELSASYLPTHSDQLLFAPRPPAAATETTGQDMPDPLPSPKTNAASQGLLAAKAVQEQLEAAINNNLQRELAARRVLVGPHRDEICLFIDGQDARRFGSQGQQRGVALALKMAEIEVLRELTGSPPMLLLDDVMSELDANRREQLLRIISADTQTFITTTNLGYFDQDTLSRAQILRLPAP